jgi:hypothetical protein
MLDNKFLRAVYACARERGISNEELHEAIQVGFDKTSIKTLTEREARQLLDGMRGKVAQRGHGASGYRDTDRGYDMAQAGRKKADPALGAGQMVGAADMKLLRDTATLRGWNEETLQAFIARQRRGVPIRTIKDLNPILWAIKSMNRRDGLVGKYDVPVQQRPQHAE